MSAAEVIDQIKHLSPAERVKVAQFIVACGSRSQRRFTVGAAADGLPVIHANSGVITSQLVHDLESLTP